MSRITPSSGTLVNVELEDDTPYLVSLASWQFENSSYQGKEEKRLVLDWQPDGAEEGDTIRDWISIKLGISKDSGQVSKLRSLLNAIAGKPGTAEIAWFDDETTEWSYDGKTAYAALTQGMAVILIGENKPKADGNGSRFAIRKYKPQQQAPAAAASKPKPAARPVAQREPQLGSARGAVVTDDDEVPF